MSAMSTSVWLIISSLLLFVYSKEISQRDIELDPYLNQLAQTDPRLIKDLKDYFLNPPARPEEQYQLSLSLDFANVKGQFNQAYEIDRLFNHNKRNGFFIEAGAHDGEILSNTLYFESRYNWTGVLVEPDPYAYEKLVQKNRMSWSLNHCLSTKAHPEIVNFDACGLYGGIIKDGLPKPGDNIPDHAQLVKESIDKGGTYKNY